MTADADIKAASDRHGKGVIRGAHPQYVSAGVRYPEQHLAIRSDAARMAKGDARPEQISGNRAARAGIQNVAAGVAAEIGDTAEPVGGVVRHGGAAAIEAEAVDAGSG